MRFYRVLKLNTDLLTLLNLTGTKLLQSKFTILYINLKQIINK